ncbi:maleylacetate reductase [Puerhibacterium puerhi]|uniref:maleylacetate reductase n=1 Tax=Puerhibacterium puerhi TaxID=2692623 RepID=UPI001F42A8F9|nr:maleylacetate reductase [Puerhibacterium puerhi]
MSQPVTAHETAHEITVHEMLPGRVLLGRGALREVPAQVDRLGARRVLVVAAPSAKATADDLAEALGERCAAVFDQPRQHAPVEVTAAALALGRAHDADGVVTLGGGSAVGLGKALVARTGWPHVAVPTTYAGTEVSPVLEETTDGLDAVRRDPALVPDTVVYDPLVTLTMPRGLTLTSALHALAHAVEALYDADGTPVTRAYAIEAAEGILNALPVVLDDPGDVVARERLQGAAWLAGLCQAYGRMGLHHQLAHALADAFDLPHAELHALLLPHVMAFNLRAAPDAAARLARVCGGSAVAEVAQLVRSHEGPTALSELGVPAAGLRTVAEAVAADPAPNPRPLDAEAVLRLLEEAW